MHSGYVVPAMLLTTEKVMALAPGDGSSSEGVVAADRVADLLRVVPTFTIVDRSGVPFMVVGEDAKVTGYFFTDYNEAKRILDLAINSADRAIAEMRQEGRNKNISIDPKELVNPWKSARISTISLETAVALATRTLSSTTKNYFLVVASADDIEDALELTGKDDLDEDKVPLFYFPDFKIKDANGVEVSPLYFHKSQLEDAFRSTMRGRNEASTFPAVRVTELFATLKEMVRPDGRNEELKSIIFVPPNDSLARAKECQRKGGTEPSFVLGQRNIVL